MTEFELVRILCYTIAPVASLIVGLSRYRQHRVAEFVIYASLSFLFVWYAIEISLTRSEIDTRGLRGVATPLVVVMTSALCVMAWKIVRQK